MAKLRQLRKAHEVRSSCLSFSLLVALRAMNARAALLSMFGMCLVVFGAVSASTTPRRAVIPTEEEALIAIIKLRSGNMGTTEERGRIAALEEQLFEAIKRSRTGDFDGDEYGAGVCTIYMYGPSANRLLAVTLPLLKKFHAPAGSYVTKRYGKPGAKEDRIPLNDDEPVQSK